MLKIFHDTHKNPPAPPPTYLMYSPLNSNGGWTVFFNSQLNMTSLACLVVSGLKFIFHYVAQLLILSKSLLRLFAEVWMSYIIENKEVSSAKSFALVERPFVRSLM